MLEKLQRKWKVSGWQFFFIMCTFAVTGTFTAWVSKSITEWINVPKYSGGWWLLKIAVLLIGYQIFLLIFGFCFGQFSFFWKYEKKFLGRLGLFPKEKLQAYNIAVFASGAGSNAKRIIEYFNISNGNNKTPIIISRIICNKPGAGVIRIAEENKVPVTMITRTDMNDPERLLRILKKERTDLIVLAGFLWKLPDAVINEYRNRIINIHPALLPKYGGKGMYGNHVHEAVLKNGDTKSGITIHYADEVYDNGAIIFQAECEVSQTDTPATLAQKIHMLEHKHFPEIIHAVIKKQNQR